MELRVNRTLAEEVSDELNDEEDFEAMLAEMAGDEEEV